MKIGLNTKKRDVRKTYLVADIGTANIKVALFYIEDGEAHIIGYSRVPQKPFSMNKAVIMDSESVFITLDKAVGAAVAQAEAQNEELEIKLPSQIVVGLAGELVTGVPIIVNVERESSGEKISEEEVQVILEKVKEHSFASTHEEIAEESGLAKEQIIEVDTVINTVAVDGAQTRKPIGLTGDTISYRVFSSYAPKIQIESIQSVIDELKLDLKKIAVEPYILSNNLEGITNDTNGSIVIDIGAGTTDIAVVKNYAVLGIKMFAIGGVNFTNRIARTFNVEFEEAEDLKIKYSEGKIDDFRKNQIRRALKDDISSWLLGLELALEEIEEIDVYPSTMYLCGGGALLPDIRDRILEYAWTKNLEFIKQPTVEMLYPNKVTGVIDETRTATSLFDATPLALTRAFFE